MFHIKQVEDNHPIWQLVEKTIGNTIHELPDSWIEQAVEDTDEYVNALAAASDFLYGLSDLGRLRAEPGEIKTSDSHIRIDFKIANDKEVRERYHRCVNEYRYLLPTFYDDPDTFEDVDLNKLCVKRVYATLMNAGYVSFYEQQDHVVTTKQIKV